MKYRNTRTGAIFESPCECSGAEWERIDAPFEPKTEEVAAKKKPAQKRTKK